MNAPMRGLGLSTALALALVPTAAAAQPASQVVSDPGASVERLVDRAAERAAELPAEGAPTPYDLATAGQAWRLATRRSGPVRVWVPNGYDAATAAVVIYVHGHSVDVDGAWTEHRLPEQFAASHLNAMFIVCGAPEHSREPVTWPSLARLLAVVTRGVPVDFPAGRTVAVGHSGAHRTLTAWLDEARLETIALVDAAYGGLSQFRAWLRRSRHHRLITVGSETRWRMDQLHRSLPGSRVVVGFPPPEAGSLPRSVRHARILYIRESREHMELVTDGVALPMLLRALRAPLVGGRARSEPLVPLPPPPEDEDPG
jgi:hypothetical protein